MTIIKSHKKSIKIYPLFKNKHFHFIQEYHDIYYQYYSNYQIKVTRKTAYNTYTYYQSLFHFHFSPIHNKWVLIFSPTEEFWYFEEEEEMLRTLIQKIQKTNINDYDYKISEQHII